MTTFHRRRKSTLQSGGQGFNQDAVHEVAMRVPLPELPGKDTTHTQLAAAGMHPMLLISNATTQAMASRNTYLDWLLQEPQHAATRLFASPGASVALAQHASREGAASCCAPSPSASTHVDTAMLTCLTHLASRHAARPAMVQGAAEMLEEAQQQLEDAVRESEGLSACAQLLPGAAPQAMQQRLNELLPNSCLQSASSRCSGMGSPSCGSKSVAFTWRTLPITWQALGLAVARGLCGTVEALLREAVSQQGTCARVSVIGGTACDTLAAAAVTDTIGHIQWAVGWSCKEGMAAMMERVAEERARLAGVEVDMDMVWRGPCLRAGYAARACSRPSAQEDLTSFRNGATSRDPAFLVGAVRATARKAGALSRLLACPFIRQAVRDSYALQCGVCTLASRESAEDIEAALCAVRATLPPITDTRYTRAAYAHTATGSLCLLEMNLVERFEARWLPEATARARLLLGDGAPTFRDAAQVAAHAITMIEHFCKVADECDAADSVSVHVSDNGCGGVEVSICVCPRVRLSVTTGRGDRVCVNLATTNPAKGCGAGSTASCNASAPTGSRQDIQDMLEMMLGTFSGKSGIFRLRPLTATQHAMYEGLRSCQQPCMYLGHHMMHLAWTCRTIDVFQLALTRGVMCVLRSEYRHGVVKRPTWHVLPEMASLQFVADALNQAPLGVSHHRVRHAICKLLLLLLRATSQDFAWALLPCFEALMTHSQMANRPEEVMVYLGFLLLHTGRTGALFTSQQEALLVLFLRFTGDWIGWVTMWMIWVGMMHGRASDSGKQLEEIFRCEAKRWQDTAPDCVYRDITCLGGLPQPQPEPFNGLWGFLVLAVRSVYLMIIEPFILWRVF